jgi:hypothetical protein
MFIFNALKDISKIRFTKALKFKLRHEPELIHDS